MDWSKASPLRILPGFRVALDFWISVRELQVCVYHLWVF